MKTTPLNQTQTRKIARSRRLTMALAGLGAAALVTVSSLSAASAHGHRGKRGHKVMRLLKHADLTDAQEAKIKAIHEKYKPVLKAQRKDGKGMRRGFHALLTSGKVSEAQAEKLRQEFVEQAEQRSVVMKDMMLEVARVLTPAQRKKLAQKMKERHQKWERRHFDE